MAAVAGGASVWIAATANRAARRRVSNELERTFQERHYAFYPLLLDKIGIADDLDPELRKLLVPYLMFYAHVWDSYECGHALNDPTWKGLRGSFEWWACTPEGRAVWKVVKGYEQDQDTYWPPGFVPYLDGVLADNPFSPSKSKREG